MDATTRPFDPPGPTANAVPTANAGPNAKAGPTEPAVATVRGSLLRFDGVERAVHWINAALFAVLILTGAALYLEPIGQLIGRRALVQNIHVYCGIALPVPLVLALCGSWGRALRADVRRFNRWSADDGAWLRALTQTRQIRQRRRAAIQVGKFNAGQKLNAAFITGAGLVMLGTGVIMRWYHPYPLSWRTGATFVHDWLALSIGVVIIGHIGMALRDPDAMRAMVTGRISRAWAKRHAPAWVDARDGPPPSPPRPTPPRPPETTPTRR
jgi:formate dehydrogenase subunit gamma